MGQYYEDMMNKIGIPHLDRCFDSITDYRLPVLIWKILRNKELNYGWIRKRGLYYGRLRSVKFSKKRINADAEKPVRETDSIILFFFLRKSPRFCPHSGSFQLLTLLAIPSLASFEKGSTSSLHDDPDFRNTCNCYNLISVYEASKRLKWKLFFSICVFIFGICKGRYACAEGERADQ